MARVNHLFVIVVSLLLIAATSLPSCVSGPVEQLVEPAVVSPAEQAADAPAWPAVPPADALQPWETLDSNGNVMLHAALDGERSASGINADSELVPGIERFTEDGSVTDLNEASRLESGLPGNRDLSHAQYRIPLGGLQPGAISADVNLHRMDDGRLSEYWLGVSDYDAMAWVWHGPFSDSHVRLSLPDGNYLSGLGNLFVEVVAFDGATFDVIGLGVNNHDPGDTVAPPAPTGLTAAPVCSGLLLEWLPVVAGDLAGYRVYYRYGLFDDPSDSGVLELNYLEGNTVHLLGGLSGETFVRIAAVDFSGNQSGLSGIVSGVPLPGDPPNLELTVSAPSGLIHDPIDLNASGADSYDWDLDGDGVYDVTGDTTGIAAVDTSGTGIIRPSVRGTIGGPDCQALGSVSLFITSNSRPVASGIADPPFGPAPLLVNFFGMGEDFDGTIAHYYWDFDGDGVFDWDDPANPNPPPQNYPAPGLTNAKFRVEDDQGAWDQDTVSVFVQEPDPGPNDPPMPNLLASAAIGTPPITIDYDATGSSDPDGIIVRYDFDLDGDNVWDVYDGPPNVSRLYTEPGFIDVTLRVTDDRGTSSTLLIVIDLSNTAPTAVAGVSHAAGPAPHDVVLYATGSSDPDNAIVLYEWDVDNDGVYELSGTSPTTSYTFVNPGIHQVGLRVTDAAGATDTDTLTVTANGWSHVTVDSASQVVGHCTAAIVNGQPAVAYYDNTAQAIKYCYSANAYGSQWLAPVTIGPGGNWSHMTLALEIVNGNPALVYLDAAGLMTYIRATDTTGSAWGAPRVPDNGAGVGEGASLAVVNGNPAISYIENISNDVRFVRATDADGNAWGAPVNANTSTSAYPDTSMIIVDGKPAIAFTDNALLDALYVRANDADGTSWPAPVTIDSAGSVWLPITMVMMYNDAISNDAPAVCYPDTPSGWNLKFAIASSTDGSTWSAPVTLDTYPTSGASCHMVGSSGNVPVVYTRYDTGDLMFTRITYTNPVTWDEPLRIAQINDTGNSCSIVHLGMTYGISYVDETNYDLFFAHLY